MPSLAHIARTSYRETTKPLALQLLNGIHDGRDETKEALELMRELTLLKTRTARMAAVKIAAEITDACIDLLLDPTQTYLGRNRLQTLVSRLFADIETRVFDVNPYQRAYLLTMLTGWFGKSDLIDWNTLEPLIHHQMMDLKPGRSNIRPNSVNQLLRVCSARPDLARAAANSARHILIVVCETASSSDRLVSCQHALEVLRFCHPPPSHEWVHGILQMLVSTKASKPCMIAAICLLWTEPNSTFQFQELVRTLSFPSDMRFADFAQCFRNFRRKAAWDAAVASLDDRSGERMLALLVNLAPAASAGEILEVFPRITDSLAGAQLLTNIQQPSEPFFEALGDLLPRADPEALTMIGQMAGLWSPQMVSQGGKRTLNRFTLREVPLALAGWVQGPTAFALAAQSRHVMLLLGKPEEFQTQFTDLAANVTSSAFASSTEVAAVIEMLVQMYASILTVGELPIFMRHAFTFREEIGNLDEAVIHKLCILVKIGATTDSSLSQYLSQMTIVLPWARPTQKQLRERGSPARSAPNIPAFEDV